MNDQMNGSLSGPTNDKEILRLVQSNLPAEQLWTEITRLTLQSLEKDDPRMGALLRKAVIPRKLNLQIIDTLCKDPSEAENNQTVLLRLAGYPFVSEAPDGRSYRVNQEIRSMLLIEWLTPRQRQKYCDLNQRLYEHFRRCHDALEALYHYFVVKPEAAFFEFENRFEEAYQSYRQAECAALLAVVWEQMRELTEGQRQRLYYLLENVLGSAMRRRVSPSRAGLTQEQQQLVVSTAATLKRFGFLARDPEDILAAVRNDLFQVYEDDIQTQLECLRTYRRNLANAELKRAQYGINVPTDVQNEIEHFKEMIKTNAELLRQLLKNICSEPLD